MQNTPPPSHSLSTGLNEFQVALFKMPYLENQDKKCPLDFITADGTVRNDEDDVTLIEIFDYSKRILIM